MKSNYPRPVQHRVLAFLILLLLALATLGGLIWRNLHHFDTVLSHVDYSHSVQNVAVELRHSLIEYLAESVPVAYPEVLTNTVKALTLTLAEIDALTANEVVLSPATKNSMEVVRQLLSELGTLDKKEKNIRLIEALKIMSQALDSELIERDRLLEQISKDTETELTVASMLLALILVIAVLFFYRRILHPLNDLRQLLERLIDESYTPITTAHLDPLLLPVFNSYNEMVKHLAELEEAKRLHAQSLQYEVRLATQALLEQQTSLARAERLAAIGEVAAKLAHEIRNPLAGIQMAFNNLRREIDDKNQCERMGLIDAELKRLARLLSEMLDQSRHAPEEAKVFDLTNLINDLLTLTRYQISEEIQLFTQLPDSLPVNLPASGMRQALLNLVLNAANALEGSVGIITIKAGLEHDMLRISVLDNGPGFSEELLKQGIRPFRTERHQGTGLGLAMVQRFVKESGGSIRLDNIEPHGARVLLSLPTGVK